MGLGDLISGAYDKAKGFVDVGFHALPTVAIGGFAVDIATAPWNDDEDYNGFLHTLESRFATRLGDFLEPIDILAGQKDEAAIDWFIPKYQRVKSYGITRPLATATLAFDKNVVGDDNWNPFSSNFRDAWNASRDISPGQAWSAAIFGGTEVMPGPLGTLGEHIGPLGKAEFDVSSPVQRDLAFKQGGFGMISSGLMDGVVTWNYDPLVLAGKGIMGAREAAVVKTIPKNMTPAQLDELLLTPVRGGSKLTRPFSGQRRVTAIFDNLEKMTPAQRADWLARNKTFAPNVGVQHLLAEAKDGDAMRFVMRAAVDGSARNMTQLAEKSLSLESKLMVLRDVRIPTIDRALDSGRLNPRMAATFQSERTALEAQLAKTQEAYLFQRHLEAVAGTVRQVPRVSMGQALGSARMGAYDKLGWGGPTWSVYQPTRYGTATRVLKSAGTRRAGTVDFNRAGSATEASKRMLDRVGHGFEKEFVPAKGFGTRGMDPKLKGALLSEIARTEARYAAGTGSTAAIEAAVLAAEKAAMEHYARAFGLDVPAVERLYQETVQLRKARAGETGMGGAERYSAVPRPEAPGRYMDEVYDNGTGEWIRNPLTTSQFKDTMPVIDVDVLSKVMHQHREALKGQNAKHFIARLEGGEGAKVVNGVVDEALSKFNRVWKPAQLFRLGWPLRVITDEQIRVIATVGLLTHLPLVAQSARHSVSESRLAYRVRDVTTDADRAVARAGLAGHIPAKAGDMERRTIVDDLHGIDTKVADLDAKVTASGARLREIGKANEGTRLFTVAPEGAKLKVTPRGARFDLDHNGRPLGPQRAGHVEHSRLGLELGDDAVHLTASRQADPGIAALEDFLGTRKLEDLYTLTNKELRIVVQREVGPKVSISRYKTKEELLSVYGATVARRQGVKAIYHARGEASGHAFVALSDDAVRAGDDTAFERAANELERLVIQRETLAARRAELTGRESQLPPWTVELQQEWNDLMARAVKPSAKRKAEGPKAKFSGTQTTTAASGQVITYDDAFGGGVGRVHMDLSSAASTVRSLAGAQDRYINGLRLQSGEHKLMGPLADDAATAVEKKAHAKSYARSWERAANDQLGKNPLANRLLNDMTDDAAVLWLTRSRQGKDMLAQHPLRGSDPRRWVEEVRAQIDQYLPSEALRIAARDGKATAVMLEREIPIQGARPIIHGESLDLVTGGGWIGPLWEQTVTKIYDKLGTAPTDMLSRHPFFTNQYRSEMERQIAALEVIPGQRITQETVEKFQHRAREHALRKVRETLYDVANSSNLAHTMRFTAPFYAAWQDALTTWGKLWMEDPSRLARMMQVWQAPSKAHITYEDDVSGKTYAVLPLPQFLKDRIPVLQGDMPANFLQSLIMSGDYWMVPGAGAPVAVPLQELTRQRPDLYPLLKPLIPYGAGEDVWDDVLPAGWRRVKSSYSREDDYSWASALQRNSMDVAFEKRIGKNDYTDQELSEEALRRTEDFYRLRTAANFALPFGARFRSPYQLYIDQAQAFREQYAAFPNGKDPGGKTWEEAFIDKNGEDYFIFTASLTKSNIGGIPATTEGFKAQQKYEGLIAQNPEYGGLIAGPEAFQGEFNSEVFQYQRTHAIGGGDTRNQRDLRSPKDAVADAEVARGWDRYRRIDTWIDTQLQSRGLRSINAKAAWDLKALKTAATDKIAAELPAWGEARKTFTTGRAGKLIAFLEENIDEAPFRDRGYHSTLAEYLSARRTMRNMLGGRQSKNLQAAENDDLRALWDAVVTKLRLANTEFADLQTRYLSNDDRLDD